jgi:hypothetical protein
VTHIPPEQDTWLFVFDLKEQQVAFAKNVSTQDAAHIISHIITAIRDQGLIRADQFVIDAAEVTNFQAAKYTSFLAHNFFAHKGVLN